MLLVFLTLLFNRQPQKKSYSTIKAVTRRNFSVQYAHRHPWQQIQDDDASVEFSSETKYGKWTLQQDGVPAHTARNTGVPRERDRFHWTWHVAPNIPDLNPVDYAVWGAFQQRVITDENSTLCKNCVVVFNVLSRTEVGISNTTIWIPRVTTLVVLQLFLCGLLCHWSLTSSLTQYLVVIFHIRIRNWLHNADHVRKLMKSVRVFGLSVCFSPLTAPLHHIF